MLYSPALSADGLTLYFASSTTLSQRIYRAVRTSTNTNTFSGAEPVPEVASAALDGTPFVTADGLALYFFSERAGGAGGRDLWWGSREGPAEPFGFLLPLTTLNTPGIQQSPWLTADGLELIFSSSGPGEGDLDIYSAKRANRSEAFTSAIAVTGLNGPDEEGRAVISSDGLTAYMTSDRPGGLGRSDVWVAARLNPESDFGLPTPLDVVNSAEAELDVFLSSDDRELMFASDRAGASGLWRAVRSCR